MSDYLGLSELLNTAEGMTAVVSSRQDDNTNALSGMAWLNFNGTSATTLYVSANSWIGIGANAEQLRICRRDGSMYLLYRQEGTLWSGTYRFLKLRFEGYSYYNSETESHRLIWEAFFIDDGRIMLNVIRTPSDGDLGTSQLVCDSTVSIPIGYNSGAPYQYILTPQNTVSGTGWSIEAHVPDVPEPYDAGYLIQDGDGRTYTIADGALQEISGGLTAQNFRDYSVATVDGSLLAALDSPKVCYWHDSSDALPIITLRAMAVPLVPQRVVMQTMILTKPIRYVSIVGDRDSLWNVSFDGGETWYKYASGWQQVTQDGDGCRKAVLGRLGAAAWAQKADGSIKFRAWIGSGGYVRTIIVEYEEDDQ